ncbi:acetyl-CoA carboxylase, carboxyltransferase subunit beta [Bacillota bacterium Meth-B3]|nr:acetyl-CoA carboxylase, carboxyltransferase subunit beta [Christensenellaceae bacterium]MEA5065301.1 acetyl-CoA carboxylase, carboxyltransferase subunit beta [Eubacteriales bacterium]MEA5069775.1 acetyl-CoA carboxylase, carboxyltransferase subunit beta [Christensenellaceae bacterium]
MPPKNLFRFRRPGNTLEGGDAPRTEPAVPGELYASCPVCRKMMPAAELRESADVCPQCGHHFRLGARARIALTVDPGSFEETNAELKSANPLGFPGYEDKLAKARALSGESEGVLTGLAKVGGRRCALFAMDHLFMMGSMGTVVGEKIARLFEHATERQLPVVGFTVSGGARMQEGILSLMQMAKTSGAVMRHAQAGQLYIAVLTDPTTGGVTASFAMEADITLSEPGALIGFAGPRVIEQTIRQKLPVGFQTAEFLREKGFVDAIADRRHMKEMLGSLLRLHTEGDAP